MAHRIEWTDERPTEPGEYWLSMPPAKRSRHGEWKAAVFAVRLVNECSLLRASHALSTGTPVPVNLVIRWLTGSANRRGPCVKSSELDGAKWSRRETPADPFAKPSDMRTDQDGREYNHDDREQKLNPDALVKKAIQHLRKRKPKNGRGYVVPLWKRVADLFGHGSGYSAEICRRHGFDPDEEWKPEQQCPDCKRLVNPEELRPAPCNYEQEVNGNDAPYVMCSQCRSERNDAI